MECQAKEQQQFFGFTKINSISFLDVNDLYLYCVFLRFTGPSVCIPASAGSASHCLVVHFE